MSWDMSPTVWAAIPLLCLVQPHIGSTGLYPGEVSPQVDSFSEVLLVQLLEELAGICKVVGALVAKPVSFSVQALNDFTFTSPALYGQGLAAVAPNLLLRNL